MSSDSSGSLEQAIMGDYIPLDIIQSCERDYRKKLNEGQLTDDVKFTYSWHLIKSRYKDDIKKGIKILGDLCQDGYDQRDYLYFMGMGYYKLEEYTNAQECVDRVLSMEPNNQQAKELKKLIVEKIRRDGLITAGMIGGAAVAGAATVGTVALIGALIAKLATSK